MKICVTFKTPDAVREALSEIDDPKDQAEFKDLIEAYVGYGEEVIIEFDTKKDTATVVPR